MTNAKGDAMHILITGQNGYIATQLASWLEQKPDTRATLIGVRDDAWQSCDFSAYDAVVHCAALVHKKETPDMAAEYDRVNAGLTRAIAEKAKREGVRRFVFLSTMAVYGVEDSLREPRVIARATETNPVTLYGKSKLAAERMLAQLADGGFYVSTVRPPMVYGKGCPGNYRLLRTLALRARVFPKIQNQRSMIFIDNLCELIFLALQKESGGLYMPQNAQPVCTYELARQIAACHGARVWVTPALDPPLRLAGRFVGKVSKAFGNLTYAPELSACFGGRYRVCGFEESVRRTEA